MAKKTNPFGLRVGHNVAWRSRWFNKKEYRNFLRQDSALRDYIRKKLARVGLERIEIERPANQIKVILYASRPGLIIGRGGKGVEELREDLKKKIKLTGKQNLILEIEELRQPESYAQIVAANIADQLERRMPFRRVIKQALDKVMNERGVEGAKIMLKGRLNGVVMARQEWLRRGRLPLQTLRAAIDFAKVNAHTAYGEIGIKVWIYKGELFKEEVRR